MNTYQTEFNPFSQNLSIVKNYFKRPLVLVLAILYAVTILLSLVSVFTMGTSMSEMYGTMFEFAGAFEEMPQEASDIFTLMTSSSTLTIILLIAMIPSIIITALYALSYFLIYFKSKNTAPNSNPKAGFTIRFVLSVLNLIYSIFTALLLVIVIAMFIIAAVVIAQEPGITSTDVTISTVLFSIAALFIAGLTAVMLIYTISNFNYIKSARNSLCTVNLSNKGAGTYGVITLIFGIISFLSVIPSLLAAPLMSSVSSLMPADFTAEFPVGLFESMGSIYLLSGIMSIFSVVVMIIDAIIALGYKKYINNITSGYFDSSSDNLASQEEPAFATAQQSATNQPTANTQQPSFQPVIFSSEPENPSVKHCPRCGTIAKDSDIFCNACGTKIS